MSSNVVAIDGPAASGKSTVARLAAARLGLVCADSGSLYRGLTWKVLEQASDGADPDRVARVMDSIRVDFFLRDGAVRFRINGVEPGSELRAEAVHAHVSRIAAMPRVRAWTLDLLRGLTRFGGLVMEGRDIGTVVFPEAPFKFYLDADASERARRRQRESAEQAGAASLHEVERKLLDRDALDSGREAAPLMKAPDARVIDTTSMTIDEVVSEIVRIVQG